MNIVTDDSREERVRKEEIQALEILKSYDRSYAEYKKSERPDYIFPAKMKGLEVVIACCQSEKQLPHEIHKQINPRPGTKIFKNDQSKDYIEQRDASALFINDKLWGFSKPIDLIQSTKMILEAIKNKLVKLREYSEQWTFCELFIFDETDCIDLNDFQRRVKAISGEYMRTYVESGDNRIYQTVFIYNKHFGCLGVISVNKPTVSFVNIQSPPISET